MNKRILICAITVLLSFSATAQSTVTTSFGTPDCGEWTKGTRPGSKIWLSGYLSGLNWMFNTINGNQIPAYDPLSELTSMDQAFVWMDNWCKTNPLDRVDTGATYLFAQLVSKRKR
ncbi:hypothetical protein [Acidovorax sp. GW101-3H11]|uniref:hypothetical protein n=1 Tax=Acidovorax sp. GW101-3H11 TaxID=1813946 RepID=UPI0010425453|nr:hypothetical protein [Acidovorax sp. GW101-3H11]